VQSLAPVASGRPYPWGRITAKHSHFRFGAQMAPSHDVARTGVPNTMTVSMYSHWRYNPRLLPMNLVFVALNLRL